MSLAIRDQVTVPSSYSAEIDPNVLDASTKLLQSSFTRFHRSWKPLVFSDFFQRRKDLKPVVIVVKEIRVKTFCIVDSRDEVQRKWIIVAFKRNESHFNSRENLIVNSLMQELHRNVIVFNPPSNKPDEIMKIYLAMLSFLEEEMGALEIDEYARGSSTLLQVAAWERREPKEGVSYRQIKHEAATYSKINLVEKTLGSHIPQVVIDKGKKVGLSKVIDPSQIQEKIFGGQSLGAQLYPLVKNIFVCRPKYETMSYDEVHSLNESLSSVTAESSAKQGV